MDIKKNDTYEYREVVKRPNLRVNLLEIGYCTEKVLFNELKEPFSGRLYFTTDTNKFYFDWKNKRHELNVYGDGGSGGSDMSIMNEIEKIKNGAGLNEDGTYTPDSTTNYLTEASSLKDADKKLDTKVKNIEDNLFEVTDLKYISDNTPTSIRTVVDDNNKLNLVIDTTDSVNQSNPLTTKTYVDSKSTLSPEQIEDIQEQVIENIDNSLFEVTDLKYISDNTPTSIRTVVDDNNKLNLVIDTTDSVNQSNPLTTKTYVDSKTGALSPEQIEDIQEQVIENIEENLIEVTDLKYMSDNTPTSIRTVVDDNNKLNLVIDTTDSVNSSNPLTTKTYVDSKTTDYSDLINKPTINGATLDGNVNLATPEQLGAKQDTLVSGTNIKTINGESILGNGNITIQGGEGGGTVIDSLDSTSATSALSANQGRELNETKLNVISCKNLCGSKLEGYSMRSNGSLETSSNYNTYDYIPVSANTDYVISMNGTRPTGFIVVFYDSSKTFISGLYEANSPYTVINNFCYKTFNTPENTAFIRFGERKTNTNVQLEVGTYPTYYIDPNQASTYADSLYQYMDASKKEMTEKLSAKTGKNLYTGLNNNTGHYITSGGITSTNGSYSVSDYIPVTAGNTYYVSANNNAAVSSSTSMYGAWYDETFSFISVTSNSMYSKSFTAPENAVYFKFSFNNDRTKIMVEDVTGVENPTRSEYEPYSEISGYYPVLRDGQVTYGKLSNEVQELLGNVKFGSFISSGELAAGVTNRISNTTQSVRKNILYSALFEGAIDSNGVVFGVGSTNSSYHGYILTITDTNIILHRLDSSGTGTPLAHGLTLTNRTSVSVETVLVSTEELNTGTSVDSPISKTIIKVSNDLGDSFTHEYGNTGWGYGQLFVGNNTANAVQYRIDFFCKDIEKPIWIFADSYGEFDYRNRFPYFMWKEGYTNHLLNAHGGAAGADALTDLRNLLSLGKKPSFIVWLMGQNGNNDTQVDGEWVIASTQRTNIDNFLALCDANDITPILCTVPSVTAPRYHHGLCEYIRNSGRRYIDWEKAVGCNPDTGAWNTGLLSSDNVHPTDTGSYVLMRQMIVDFPEIAVL